MVGYDIPITGVTSRYLLFHLVSLLNRRLLLRNQCVYVQSLTVINSGGLGEQNLCGGDGFAICVSSLTLSSLSSISTIHHKKLVGENTWYLCSPDM